MPSDSLSPPRAERHDAPRVVHFQHDTPMFVLDPLTAAGPPAISLGELHTAVWLLPSDLTAARRLAAAAQQVVALLEIVEQNQQASAACFSLPPASVCSQRRAPGVS